MFPYWSQAVGEITQRLGSTSNGLSQEEALDRLQRLGPNRIQTEKRSTALSLFLNQFRNPLMLILVFATFLSAFLRDWPDAGIILAIVMGSAVLSFLQEYSASNAAAQLRAQVSLETRVVRDGRTDSVPTEQIVPGDVVLLSAGSLVPADGVVLEAADADADAGRNPCGNASTGRAAGATPGLSGVHHALSGYGG